MTNLKDITVTCIDNGLYTDFCLHLAPAFGKMYYWSPWASSFPKSNSMLPGDGFEEMQRVKWPHDAIAKSDLIIFPDVYYGDWQEALVKQGKLVWGARKGEVMELNRMMAKKIMEDYGVQPSPADVVTGIDALREYLKEHEDVWIKVSTTRGDFETFKSHNYELSMPKLDELEHDLGAKKTIEEFIIEPNIEPANEWGIDAYTIDGQWPVRTYSGWETKDLFFVGRVMEWNEIPKYLREPNEKLSPWFKEKQYRGFFSTELRILKNRETYLIDPCCYSADTEVLTNRGWKLFPDVEQDDEICTLNPSNQRIEYHKPSAYIAYVYNGEMVKITSPKRVLDLMVTPNHSIWANRRTPDGELVEVRADSANEKYSIPRTGNWSGHELNEFVVPHYHNDWKSGRHMATGRTVEFDAKIIHGDLWLKFMALYLSEGHCDRWVVNITQTKYKDQFREVISALPFKWSEHKKGFRIFSVQLVEMLGGIPDRSERGIPDYIKHLPPRQINLFLDFYTLGDGHVKHGNRQATTTSKTTANDLQELFLKAGSVADIAIACKAGTPVAISGGKYISKHDSLLVRERKNFTSFYFEGWNNARHGMYLSHEHYHGWVFDVQVPNHIIYVRRNGKPCWSGNCRLPSPPNEIQQMVFSNWPEIIYEGAKGNMVEPKVAYKYGVCAMIHSAWADKNWQSIQFHETIREFVKLRNHCRIDGVDYFVPVQQGLPEIGAVIGLGNTLDEACDHLKENAEQVKGYYLDIKVDQLDASIEEARKGEELGLEL